MYPVKNMSTQELIKIMELINNINVTGIPGIVGATGDPNPVPVKISGTAVRKEYVLYTRGTNYTEVMKMSGIDRRRTISTDIDEMYEVFGIEGARYTLFSEIKSIFNDNGIDINPQIISVLVDYMTYSGKVIGLKWRGMDEIDAVEPFQKFTHERYESFIVDTSIRGLCDNMKSPSSCIITGNQGSYGTGLSELSN
jgi:hypothetical protein